MGRRKRKRWGLCARRERRRVIFADLAQWQSKIKKESCIRFMQQYYREIRRIRSLVRFQQSALMWKQQEAYGNDIYEQSGKPVKKAKAVDRKRSLSKRYRSAIL